MAATAANPFPYWQPAAGIDFSPGKMFGGKDLYKIASPSRYQAILKNGLESGAGTPVTAPPATSTNIYETGQAVPDINPAAKAQFDFLERAYPYQVKLMQDAARIQQQQNEQGFASAYPWVNQAAQGSTARSLKASEAYRSFVESQPSSVQNIMASKQAQMTSAPGAEADRARAIAAQTQAAKDFAGRYTGQTFSVG
jgi:hypothetical protein